MSQSKICISSNGDTIKQGNGLEQGWQIFSVKDQGVNILGFVGHTVSVMTTQLCGCIIKAATDDV